MKSVRWKTLRRVHLLAPRSSLARPGGPPPPRRNEPVSNAKIFRSCREQKRHEILWAGSLAKILFTWPEPDISYSIRSVWFPPCWQWGCSGALPKNQKQLKFCVFPAYKRSARSIGRRRESARLVQSCHEKVKHSRLKIFKGRAENRRKRCAGRSVLSFLAFEPGVQVSVTIPIRIGEQNRVISLSTCGAPPRKDQRAHGPPSGRER